MNVYSISSSDIMSERNKPKTRLSGSKGKKKKGTPKDNTCASVTPPISSFFKNTPPPQLACPLCGQLVPRYSINDHIDLQCKNFERGDHSSPRLPRKELSPQKNEGPQSPAKDSPSTQSEETKETSPYFKKHCTRQMTRAKSNASVVRKVDLGGLSSKMSRTHGRRLDRESDSELSGSQKENLCAARDDNEDCFIVSDPQVSHSEKNSTSITNPPCSADEQHIMEVNHDDTSKVETVHPMFSQRLSSPSSKLTKRKAKELPGDSVGKMSSSSKKPKCEGIGGESNKTLSSVEHAEISDTNNQQKEPSTAPSLWNYAQKVQEKADESLVEGAILSEHSVAEPTRTSESINHSRLPYYLRNFRTVLEAVLENEDDRELFNHEDLSSIHAFEKLSGILKYDVFLIITFIVDPNNLLTNVTHSCFPFESHGAEAVREIVSTETEMAPSE